MKNHSISLHVAEKLFLPHHSLTQLDLQHASHLSTWKLGIGHRLGCNWFCPFFPSELCFLQFWDTVLTSIYPHFVPVLFSLSWHLRYPPTFCCSQDFGTSYNIIDSHHFVVILKKWIAGCPLHAVPVVSKGRPILGRNGGGFWWFLVVSGAALAHHCCPLLASCFRRGIIPGWPNFSAIFR